MSKPTFAKLGLVKNQDIKIIEYNNQQIEVKQYLPINEKLKLINDVIDYIIDSKNYINDLKLNVVITFEIINYYTNISFTDKQKEDLYKLFDLFDSNNFQEIIFNAIPEKELNNFITNIKSIVTNIQKYRNSALGILDTISLDYSNLDLDAQKIQKEIADPNNLTLLKDVINKLG